VDRHRRGRHRRPGVVDGEAIVGGGYDISASTSNAASAANRVGEGDFIVYGGGTKQAVTMYYVIGGIVVAILAGFGLWLWLKK